MKKARIAAAALTSMALAVALHGNAMIGALKALRPNW